MGLSCFLVSHVSSFVRLDPGYLLLVINGEKLVVQQPILRQFVNIYGNTLINNTAVMATTSIAIGRTFAKLHDKTLTNINYNITIPGVINNLRSGLSACIKKYTRGYNAETITDGKEFEGGGIRMLVNEIRYGLQFPRWVTFLHTMHPGSAPDKLRPVSEHKRPYPGRDSQSVPKNHC
jgi:hypothetical protein|tara:strand:- start:812 stop:1345 length:534 start_codon:yes stop_codon:yes gene_type:complete